MTTPKWAAPPGMMDNQNDQVNHQDQTKTSATPNYFKNLSSFQKLLPPALTVLVLIVFLSLTLIANRQQKVFRSRASYPTPTPIPPCSGYCLPNGERCKIIGTGSCPAGKFCCMDTQPTRTPTPLPTAFPSLTSFPTRTPTPFPTNIPTHTPTPTPSRTPTPSPTTPTRTPTPIFGNAMLITLWSSTRILGRETTIYVQNTDPPYTQYSEQSVQGRNQYNHQAIFEHLPFGNYNIWADMISECDQGFDRWRLTFDPTSIAHNANDQISIHVNEIPCSQP